MSSHQDTKDRWILRARHVLLPDRIAPASIHIQGGAIVKVGGWNDIEASTRLFDAGDQAILPGVVDVHAHINEPGRTAWEGFESATRAAAAGGITTLLDMPLNSIPPTVNSDALAEKVAATRGKLWIDVGFHGGIVPGNGSELPRLLREGVVGLKCFLCASGVEEFSPVTLGQLAAAIDGVAGLDPWILVHAESPEVLRSARSELDATSGPWTYDDYLRSRPDEAECLAIRQLIHLVETSAAHIHVVHLSSAVALKSIAEAKTSRLAITAETCPHYLTFDAESIADAATELKCAPPIRSAANREALWSGLKHGIIDIIASDHSPCRTEAHRRGFSLTDLTRWMCRRPAELANLPAKGSIAPGKDADLICFAPDETFVFDEQQILHRHKTTPYSGRRMRGVVKQTFLRGVMIYDRGSWGGGPQGQILRAQPRSAGEIALTS